MEQEGAKTRRFEDCSGAVIGACIEVHRHLGPGLLESAYEHCVAYELGVLGLRFDRQRPVPLRYKGVDRLLPIHHAQLITYLRLTKLQTGLLVNFRESVLKNGLKRLILSPFASSRLPVNPPRRSDS
ncbi:MAG: GxxExxY protein [Polyangiaceae bacterium]